ncbi:tryptophan synthase subunit alpha [Laribacter hongkongensis]|uniref:Tryptophan synthase alpha chain n=1 Tax=Laribacter hongkongensis TaxID=168471 RepID=A0ABD4SPP4_9NEIS|nr:tryptophan synthase subunit alpha [Laribacter hongkongensis]MCG8993523.1 tryptophan synthase subunit alpha [Laribacter hongkongensis]MCG9002082.1 tryptophan synthase subunit alpha [Laribacter hongkongensis]MCG9008102.1 tryptophan synthase subunit alpha [Laribacter hongkongensis]MCG9017474.1 tryptophan synthase subunit alpha [Laribacter hongkongensis]MCG9025716.1 tryptophan synthase subunit alpha [Laribacter hongkongensis]
MNRIDERLAALKAAGRKALIPFITAGDPEPDMTVSLMHALVRGGADVIELGIPFSDPMADGPVIQRASERALARGMTLTRVLEMVAGFRRTDPDTPVVLMGYLNPVEAMGYAAFASAARAAGVDGVLTVDCPPEESDEYAQVLQSHGLATVFLVAPTTPAARLAAVARLARGYVYYVSIKGVTGAATLDVADVARQVGALREHLSLPVGVGFGIRDAETARAIGEVADAVVIGSRLVQEIEAAGAQAPDRLQALLAGIRQALDA